VKAKKYLIYHISKNNHHSKKRFPVFYSSSQSLSNDIIFTSDFTKNYSTFWWRHNLPFCHNLQIKINWRTKKAHLPNLVQKYINQANIAFMKPPPKCFVSSWLFHIISHYLKSIDSFYTKLGRWAGDLLPIIFMKNVSKCQSCYVTVMTSCFWPLLKFLICIFFTMCSKEHIKGSWNLKKFCPYHKN